MSPSPAASPPVATRPSGPVRPGDRARIGLRPAGGARITGGFWRERRRASVETSIPHGPPLLESAGNLHDLRSAAGTADGAYRGVLPFLDSDVTKWLEDSSWQLADPDTPDRTTLSRAVDVMIRLLTEAQQDDDCLQTWYQVTKPGPGSPSRSGAMSCTAPVISSRPPSPTAAPPDARICSPSLATSPTTTASSAPASPPAASAGTPRSISLSWSSTARPVSAATRTSPNTSSSGAVTVCWARTSPRDLAPAPTTARTASPCGKPRR